jgi:hypothetical protein
VKTRRCDYGAQSAALRVLLRFNVTEIPPATTFTLVVNPWLLPAVQGSTPAGPAKPTAV